MLVLCVVLDGCVCAMCVHPPPALCHSQVSTQPPTFVVFANRSDVPQSYLRFLVNALREEFGFLGVPVRMHVRGPKNPYK